MSTFPTSRPPLLPRSRLAPPFAPAPSLLDRARLSLAQQQLVRARELGDRGFFSKEAVASRETEVQVLRAEGEQASTQLDAALRAVGKCSVRSPFAAIVRERLGQVGELATPGSPLVALSDAGRVEVSAQVQLRDAESLRAARDVRFVGDGGSTAVALLRVSPAIAPQARTVEARLRFKSAPAAAGASGSVIWRESRPYIPAEFVVRRELRTRHESLAGLYDGAPHKTTDRPTTERLLKAFQGITLLRIHVGQEVRYQLSGFSKLHRRILQLLGLPSSLYTLLESSP